MQCHLLCASSRSVLINHHICGAHYQIKLAEDMFTVSTRNKSGIGKQVIRSCNTATDCPRAAVTEAAHLLVCLWCEAALTGQHNSRQTTMAMGGTPEAAITVRSYASQTGQLYTQGSLQLQHLQPKRQV